jgi:hypothetical protein
LGILLLFGLRIRTFLLQIGQLQTTFHLWEQVASITGEDVQGMKIETQEK